ncbi:MAG: hypothetical protein JXP73_10055 [Deltaproteobacteria bacterium]|nr:hypothetical protein [Deltaproteobacteria bacterium]
MKSAIGVATFFSAVLFLGNAARADVPPPETEPCVGKQVGDACVYNGSGTCQNQTCSKLDYASWDRDASSSPPSTTYACVKCVVGTPTETNTATATNTNADGGEPPSEEDSGCSIGRRTTAKRVVPWLLAATFSLLFLYGRRRR